MAAVQEYLLKHSKDPQKCVASTDSLVKQYDKNVNIPLFEWLWRLNLPQYHHKFFSKKIASATEMLPWMKEEEIDQENVFTFRKD